MIETILNTGSAIILWIADLITIFKDFLVENLGIAIAAIILGALGLLIKSFK